jgi:kelch-like protein 2/3
MFQPNFKLLFEARPSVIPTLGLRMHQTLVDCGIELGCIAQYSIPSSPPWLLQRPYFDYTLYSLGTKSETLPDLYLSRYRELVSSYQNYEQIFTDGSKKGSAVSAAAVTFGKVLVKRLPDHSSIFSAESRAVLLALDIMKQSCERRFLVVSDSLSCLKSVEDRNFQNPLILEILETLDKLFRSGYRVTFVWVPSHIGIEGNGAADATAKAALSLRVSKSSVPYSDFKPLVCAYVNSAWQKCWDRETNNKLHGLQPVIGNYRHGKLTRRDEVAIHRLRVGHSHLTHSYLLKKEQAPVCHTCNSPLTIEHMMIACSKYDSERQKYFNHCNSLADLFNSFSSNILIDYIKEIGIYRKL